MAQQVAVPERVQAMGLLDRVDYGDAFAVDAPPEVLARYTPDELAELAMGRAPRWVRGVVRVAHQRVLGLRLAPSSPSVPVPGWQRLHSGPDQAVYGATGGLITPRILVMKQTARILVVTLMRLEHPVARPIVAAVKPVHRAIARYLLDRGARLAATVEQQLRHDVPMAHPVQITVDAHDTAAQADFWALALGYVLQPPPPGYDTWIDFAKAVGIPEQEWDRLNAVCDPDGAGPRVLFQKVPEPKAAKNRVHLDVNVAAGLTGDERKARAYEHRDRLIAAGAAFHREVDEPSGWCLVMSDPEGNEFCIQ